MSLIIRAAACMGCLFFVAPAFGAISLVDLGVIGSGTKSDGYALTASGAVVGNSTTTSAASPTHAVLYSGGSTTDLGTLGGTNATAYGVNNNGVVVGSSATTGTTPIHGFYYDPAISTMRDIGTLGTGTNSTAYGVNSSGVAVGYSSTIGAATNHAVSYTPTGGLVDVSGVALGASLAYAINDTGTIVGSASFAGNSHAAVFTGIGSATDLGTLGGLTSQARAISSTGEVVGYSNTAAAATSHAFAEVGGSMVDLGTLGGTNSFGYGVNSSGVVVGSSAYIAGNFAIHAFAYAVGLGMVDLNTVLGSTTSDFTSLTSAQGINDQGQIVGYGVAANGQTHAFLLTGFSLTGNAVPEPGSWLLASIGLAGILGAQRISRQPSVRG